MLANAYVDLGTWWCVTPFIGAGVGAARVTIANFTDIGINDTMAVRSNASVASAPTASKWNLAWARTPVWPTRSIPSLTLELAYSYLDLGDGRHRRCSAPSTAALTGQPSFKFKDITSHDLKLGVRWNLDSPPVYRAAADAQGLIDASHLLVLVNGAGASRAVLFCATASPRQRLIKVNRR